jgi:hypothetical protein
VVMIPEYVCVERPARMNVSLAVVGVSLWGNLSVGGEATRVKKSALIDERTLTSPPMLKIRTQKAYRLPDVRSNFRASAGGDLILRTDGHFYHQ